MAGDLRIGYYLTYKCVLAVASLAGCAYVQEPQGRFCRSTTRKVFDLIMYQKLGEGGYGTICSAIARRSGEPVAIKRIAPTDDSQSITNLEASHCHR